MPVVQQRAVRARLPVHRLADQQRDIAGWHVREQQAGHVLAGETAADVVGEPAQHPPPAQQVYASPRTVAQQSPHVEPIRAERDDIRRTVHCGRVVPDEVSGGPERRPGVRPVVPRRAEQEPDRTRPVLRRYRKRGRRQDSGSDRVRTDDRDVPAG